jgi:glycosyltransferase involved in cell wall biosynthesis
VASKREDIGADALKRLVYSKRLKRLALELSDSVVAVGSELPTTVGFDGPYEVIAPAVDPEYFRPANRIGARVQLGLPFDEHLLLFPADPSLFQKGADVFHKSMSHLHVPVRTIYGGSIPRDQMPLYMNAADVVVQTSRFEASPMVVKEAFACDTPVVSTDVGDVAQLFGDLPGCFITASEPAAVADAIQRGLEFDGGTGGPERIRELRLTPHAVANRYHRLFTTLARSAGDCRLTDR